MNADTLARLIREAEAPEGIAVRVSGPEMKRLLAERVALLSALSGLADCRLDNEGWLQIHFTDEEWVCALEAMWRAEAP